MTLRGVSDQNCNYQKDIYCAILRALPPHVVPMITALNSVEPASKSSGYVRKEFTSLKAFLSNPTRQRPYKLPRSDYWKRIAFLLALDLCFSSIMLLLFTQIPAFDTLDFKHDYKNFVVAFIAVLIVPPIEELIFRLGLRSFKYSLIIGPAIIAALAASWWVLLTLGVVLAMEILYLQIKLVRSASKDPGWSVRLGRQFILRFRWVFWFWAISFSIVHIGNYNIASFSDWVVIFAVLPQFFAGILWSYARLRMNISAAIMLHMMHNGILLMIALS